MNKNPRECLICKKIFVPKATARRGIYCSFLCRQKGIAQATIKQRADKMRYGGQRKGYVKRNGRHEHRIIAEQKLGRKLILGEIVHHLNGNKQDNRPENLEVMTQSQHFKEHFPPKPTRYCSIENCGRTHMALGFCSKHWQKQKARKNGIKPRPNKSA